MIKQLQTLDSKHIPNLMDWCLEKAQKIIQKRLNFSCYFVVVRYLNLTANLFYQTAMGRNFSMKIIIILRLLLHLDLVIFALIILKID